MKIDYSLTVHEAVQKCACPRTNRDIQDENVTDLYPTPAGQADVEFRFFALEVSSAQEAIDRMTISGYRPATAKEALLMAAEKPQVQLKHPIIVLGSKIRTGRQVGALLLWEFERGLNQEELEHFCMPMLALQRQKVRSALLAIYEMAYAATQDEGKFLAVR